MRIESGTPIVILSDGREFQLDRISGADPTLHEAMIQELVTEHPSVLPVSEIDTSFLPLIPIGREIPTSAGPIDALYITPGGALTLVEAKLWRNPQARREVVGQIIDYATSLAQWSFQDLDDVCKATTGRDLWALAGDANQGSTVNSQAEFVDSVARGLRQGRFLLLIVGDGIREEVERMAAYVQAAPQLRFTLGLVELRIYRNPVDGSRLVVPSIVARTEEVTRAVVHVDVAPEAQVAVTVAVPSDDSPTSRRKLTLEQFYAELAENGIEKSLVDFVAGVLQEFDQDPRFFLLPGSASVSLRLRNPARSGASFTVLVFTNSGTVYTGWLKEQCERYGVPIEVGLGYVADIAEITGRSLHHRHPDTLDDQVPFRLAKSTWSDISERITLLAEDVHAVLG